MQLTKPLTLITMKKIIILTITALFPIIIFAQAPYILLVGQETYEPLSDPISINQEEVWNEWDSYPVYFGFTVPIFNGEVSSVNLNPGYGFNFPAFGDYHLYLYHWPFGGPLLLDRGYNSEVSQSPLSFQITGNEGNRIIKLQWENAGFVMDIISNEEYYEATNSDSVSFQIWIYENDGKIKLHFGPNSITNENSYGNWNGGVMGPFSKFIIGNYLFDIYGNADNPSYDWYSNEGIQYGQMLIGTPSEGVVYTLNPNFDNVAMSEPMLVQNKINYRWNPIENSMLIDIDRESYFMGSVNVYAIDGRLIFTDIIDSHHSNFTISNIEEGIYIVKVAIDKSIQTFKIKK